MHMLTQKQPAQSTIAAQHFINWFFEKGITNQEIARSARIREKTIKKIAEGKYLRINNVVFEKILRLWAKELLIQRGN